MWFKSILGNPNLCVEVVSQLYELGVLCVDFNLNINNELNQRQTPYVVHEEDQVTKSMVANMTVHFFANDNCMNSLRRNNCSNCTQMNAIE